jgi:hypothetical protein
MRSRQLPARGGRGRPHRLLGAPALSPAGSAGSGLSRPCPLVALDGYIQRRQSLRRAPPAHGESSGLCAAVTRPASRLRLDLLDPGPVGACLGCSPLRRARVRRAAARAGASSVLGLPGLAPLLGPLRLLLAPTRSLSHPIRTGPGRRRSGRAGCRCPVARSQAAGFGTQRRNCSWPGGHPAGARQLGHQDGWRGRICSVVARTLGRVLVHDHGATTADSRQEERDQRSRVSHCEGFQARIWGDYCIVRFSRPRSSPRRACPPPRTTPACRAACWWEARAARWGRVRAARRRTALRLRVCPRS